MPVSLHFQRRSTKITGWSRQPPTLKWSASNKSIAYLQGLQWHFCGSCIPEDTERINCSGRPEEVEQLTSHEFRRWNWVELSNPFLSLLIPTGSKFLLGTTCSQSLLVLLLTEACAGQTLPCDRVKKTNSGAQTQEDHFAHRHQPHLSKRDVFLPYPFVLFLNWSRVQQRRRY